MKKNNAPAVFAVLLAILFLLSAILMGCLSPPVSSPLDLTQAPGQRSEEFPDFEKTDLDGNPLSISRFRGNVVLLDFWATWCGPCIGEMPNVIRVYDKYHRKGFEIIGISLDTDKDALQSFIKDYGIKWPQYFDGKGWENELARAYEVNSIPATYLLDGEGRLIAENLRGPALEKAVAKALRN